MSSSTHAVFTSVIEELHHPLQLLTITLSVPNADMTPFANMLPEHYIIAIQFQKLSIDVSH